MEIMNAVKFEGLQPDVTKVLTHRFSGLDSIPDAYEAACKTRDAESQLIIKAAVTFWDSLCIGDKHSLHEFQLLFIPLNVNIPEIGSVELNQDVRRDW